MKKEATPTLPIAQALDAAFNAIRARHPELRNAVLVVGATGRSGRGMKNGHFAPNRWASDASHEILISGESFQRGAEATLGTLLHECAHALAFERGVQDTSRQGRFHNKKFRAIAEEVGIEVAHDPSIGWSLTTLPEATAVQYGSELAAIRKSLTTHRRAEVSVPKVTEPRTIKLETPSGRKLTVPIKFFEEGNIFDAATGEMFVPAA